MSRGQEFLIEVTEKLNTKIQELGRTIREVQEDIAGMNDYYWENYTEMDQYGYENFDNRQALLIQMNANQENHKKWNRLKKMVDSPFFGSVDFVYDGDEEAETFYIGIGNFSEKTGQIPLIYDWRAPVSGLFYDFDKGEASYESPAGLLTGEILSKWQYKIRRGRMIYEFESDVKIDDDILKQELGSHGDVKLKNIVRTIQKEQNAIIRNTKDKILVIQGAAGSGKTSVALHRIAYLLYHDRTHLSSSNILILSPNSVFSDYISHILPELGEEHIREMSFDLFAFRELREIAADCEDRYHHIERCISHYNEEADKRYRWKQSEEFVRAAEGFLVFLEDDLVEFCDIEMKGMRKTADELMQLFYYKFPETPLLSRMEAVMEYVIDEYETLRGRDLNEEERIAVSERFLRMYVTTDIYQIYNRFLEDNGWETLPDVPKEKRVLAYEDVFPMLYLKYRLCSNNRKNKEVKHLVIDEMQDYSYLQYVVLDQMFSCSMTILGDRAQTVDAAPRDVLTFLPSIFGKNIRRIEMNSSYRNTLEIAEYAAKITDVKGIRYLERHGKPVTEKSCISKEEAMEEILREVRIDETVYETAGGLTMTEEEAGYETAAVLTMTEEEAAAAYCYLKSKRDDVNYIDRDSSEFRRGITVTTYYLAKGLEFDQVFVLGGKKESPLSAQFRYISATRALHELYVYSIG